MPTYRNDTGTNVVHKGETVLPGGTVSTVEFLTLAGMTKLSDAPYFNPYQFFQKLTFSGAGSQTLTIPDPATCPLIRIMKVTDGMSVTIYIGSKADNPVPIALDWDIYDGAFEFDTEYSVGSLVIEASAAGSVYILGMQDFEEEIDDA